MPLGLTSRGQRRDGLSRSMVEQLLTDAPEGLTVDELSERLGRHPNTVRGHLDVLVSQGLVARVAEARRGPGRPRHRYRLVAAPEESLTAVATLASAMAEELGRGTDEESLALRAGRRWADQITPADQGDVSTCDESVQLLADTMRRAGFGCEVDPVGDRLHLTRCPYGAMVTTAPAICTLHLYLAQATLAEHAAGVAADRIEVDVVPGLCVLHLQRPDRTPRRVVSLPEEGPAR